MLKFNISLADLKIEVNCRYEYLREFCRDYILEDDVPCDIIAKTTDDEIAAENGFVPEAQIESCESLCIYRSIAERLPDFSRFVFHGAAISYGGKAYLFTAPSGTGKTTHISLWKRYKGDAVGIVNGDKPILHIADDVTAYGTPWAGKENYQRNTSAALGGICIVTRGKENKIRKLQKAECVKHIMRQVYLPKDASALTATLSLIDSLINKVPVYLLECDISEEAVKTSFCALTGEEY